MTKHITKKSPRMASDANAMTQKGNVLLYLDKDLVEKSRELWFSLSRTFEKSLKTANHPAIKHTTYTQ